jgi:aminoglycoside phosphotransferase (APT) family kinase protein
LTLADGIDVPSVSAWLTATVDGLHPPFNFELIAGGRSNLTYRVIDSAGKSLALRRPPVSHVLPTAHDMTREHTVISALGKTDVPVPETYGLCTDESVTGAPFYVMAFVEGHILRDESSAASLDEEARRHASESLVDNLALLHDVDVEAVGLDRFGRHEAYIERQLKRWHGQFIQSEVGGNAGPPIINHVHRVLAAQVPQQQGVGIVHGDYRLDNTVLGDDGTVKAILDWEISTLGDPLADLGLLLVYWTETEDIEASLVGVGSTRLPGFATRAELETRYSILSDRDLSAISYYKAFGFWKLACILQGVYARYAGGAGAGDRSNTDTFPLQVNRLAERALAEVESL